MPVTDPAHRKVINARYYQNNKAVLNGRSRSWQARNPEKVRVIQKRTFKNAKRKRLYGITDGEYDAMVEAQGNLCAICGRPETVRGKYGDLRALAVDHDHETGEVRALLCSRCNIGIGLMGDDPDLCIAAAKYLSMYGNRAVG